MKLFALLFISAFAGLASPLWLTNMEEAKKQAASSHHYILLNFSGSDWCGPCIRMKKEIFSGDAFGQYAGDHLVLVNADFPRLSKNQLSKEQASLNEALADKYNREGHFPYTVLLDPSGKVIHSWDGFPNESSEKFVGELKSLIHEGN